MSALHMAAGLAALLSGLSSISLFAHWRRAGQGDWLGLAVLAAGAMWAALGQV